MSDSQSVIQQKSSPMGLGRQPYVLGKNYCDYCNKEVCNKYFLRTHMLKMHGISIDENRTIIGNINTIDIEKHGNLKFRYTLFKILSTVFNGLSRLL